MIVLVTEPIIRTPGAAFSQEERQPKVVVQRIRNGVGEFEKPVNCKEENPWIMLNISNDNVSKTEVLILESFRSVGEVDFFFIIIIKQMRHAN